MPDASSGRIAVAVADGVCTVTIDRPEKKNSLTRPMYAGLADAIAMATANDAVRALLITGAGDVFCAGNDIVYAATTARFRLPFVDLGVVPELGSSMLLPLLAGHHRAAELLMLGEFFDAAMAREIGLVNRVLDAAELLPNATATACALASKPPHALRATKTLLRHGAAALAAHMETERRLFAEALASPETQAIMATVLKKRA